MFVDYILNLYILDIQTMASRKISVNVSGSRAAMIASKITVEVSENVEPQDKMLTFE